MYIFAKNILEGRGETQNNFVMVNKVEPVKNQDMLLMLLDIGLILSMLKICFL